MNSTKKIVESRTNSHILELNNEFLYINPKSEQNKFFGDLRHRNNVIKINRAKLPADFFPKCWSFEKRSPHLKIHINQHDKIVPSDKNRKVQSERLHNSPQKGSLFNLFQQEPFKPLQLSSKTIPTKRKFETRQQTKRQNSQVKRRFTPGTNIQRNQILDIFPSKLQNEQILNSISAKKIQRLSPRKQYHKKCQQMVYDPQKYDEEKELNHVGSKVGNLISLKSIEKTVQDDKKAIQTNSYVYTQTDLHNMTFFNAKSSSLPPIKKA